MEPLKKTLEKLAGLEAHHNYKVLIAFGLITLFLLSGLPNIRLQTDLSKILPQDIPAVMKKDKVSKEIGGTGTIIILAKLDRNTDLKSGVQDIRNPEVIESLSFLQEDLKENPKVQGVKSVASAFPMGVPSTTENVRKVLKRAPETGEMFNKDYTATLMMVSANVPQKEEKIEKFISDINKDIDSAQKPSNLKYMVTGEAPSRMDLLKIIKSDMIVTTGIALLLIFILLIIIERSILDTLLTLTPLLIGLIWTFGIIGLIGMKLSIATVAVGGMILGLGVEYGVFMKERYREERKNNEPEKAVKKALPSVGKAIIGSGTTTTFAFLSLLLATVPMIRSLGIILALGILMCLTAVIACSPALLLTIDKIGVNKDEG